MLEIGFQTKEGKNIRALEGQLQRVENYDASIGIDSDNQFEEEDKLSKHKNEQTLKLN